MLILTQIPSPKELEDDFSYIQHFMNDHLKKVTSEFNQKLQEYVIKNLEALGYTFASEADFYEFTKEHITQVSFPGDPNRFEIYLDYKDPDNKGTLIGIYSNHIETKENGGIITTTIG